MLSPRICLPSPRQQMEFFLYLHFTFPTKVFIIQFPLFFSCCTVKTLSDVAIILFSTFYLSRTRKHTGCLMNQQSNGPTDSFETWSRLFVNFSADQLFLAFGFFLWKSTDRGFRDKSAPYPRSLLLQTLCRLFADDPGLAPVLGIDPGKVKVGPAGCACLNNPWAPAASHIQGTAAENQKLKCTQEKLHFLIGWFLPRQYLDMDKMSTLT